MSRQEDKNRTRYLYGLAGKKMVMREMYRNGGKFIENNRRCSY